MSHLWAKVYEASGAEAATVLHDLVRQLTRVVFLYACWLAMLATHEAGHVLHAWISGGRVERVVLPLFGFSRTDLAENPWPLFVAWGGALWGCLLPAGMWGVTVAIRPRLSGWLQFFTGFCLIANGAYLAAGSMIEAGDTGDLLRHGAPLWTLIASGILGIIGGLWLWHVLGLKSRHKTTGTTPDRSEAD